MKSLNISEIFYSLQGETTFAGLPCIFVRLAGCNLRCSYCDTKYAYKTEYTKTILELIKEIEKYLPAKLVTITGGEPLIQSNVYELIDKLLEKNYKILLETNGSLPLDDIPEQVYKIMDIKTPGSGMSNEMLWDNLSLLDSKDEIKFVIKDKKDFNWSVKKIEKFKLEKMKVLFSPAYKYLDIKELASWILEAHKNLRLQVQLQKYIWGDRKGV